MEVFPGEQIVINNETYEFQNHPLISSVVFGMEGRKATVYQLRSLRSNIYFALKVFKKRFRNPTLETTFNIIRKYRDLPGLEVADCFIINPRNNLSLIEKHPDLSYAVLMPWISGSTCFDIFLTKRPISKNSSKEIALNLCNVLSNLELRNLAHTDLSSSNVIIDLDSKRISLVGLENMYSRELPKPDAISTGTPSYRKYDSQELLWKASGDRFAGSILLMELLCWHKPEIVDAASEESYFEPDELGNDSPRSKLIISVAKEINVELSNLFTKVWYSQTTEECPPFYEWYRVLNKL